MYKLTAVADGTGLDKKIYEIRIR